MPALSPVKKERVGLGGSRMGTKENKIAKAGRPCSWECHENKFKHTLIQKYFFLQIMINVKAGRVKSGARKVYRGRHGARGRRVGQPWFTSSPQTRSSNVPFFSYCDGH
jgi:hypothetical protein